MNMPPNVSRMCSMDDDLNDALMGITVQLARIYDVMILNMTDPELRANLIAKHDEGELLCGPPSMSKTTLERWNVEVQ